MATIIDETVILRYVLNDNKKQAKQAHDLILSGDAYTYPEIFARVAVTLRDAYRVPRSVIGTTLCMLLDDIQVTDEDIVRYASRLFGSSLLDYADCLMIARNALQNLPIMTFDKPLMKRSLP